MIESVIEKRSEQANRTRLVHIQDPSLPFPNPFCGSKVQGVECEDAADCMVCCEMWDAYYWRKHTGLG